MKEPGSAFDDPPPREGSAARHMNNFVRTFEDNGGVHINSGIPNHAFFQVATLLGGHAWKSGPYYMYDARDAREAKHRVPAVCTDYVRGRRAPLRPHRPGAQSRSRGLGAVGIAV